MDDVDWKKAGLKDKYGRFVEEADRSIFTRDNRRKMYGAKRISGKDVSINNFWYDRRNQVKTAFKDIELFLDTARESDIPQSINFELLKPLIETYFYFPTVMRYEPDPIRAETARWLIKYSLDYLMFYQGENMSRSNKQTVEDTIDIARILANLFLPPKERPISYEEYVRGERGD